MIKLSDHIFWQPTRMSADPDNVLYVFAMSTSSVVCFSLVIAFHLLYVIMAEKNHAIGRQALHKGIAWFGATLIAFAIASMAALNVALFVAGHHANHVKAIFKEKVLYPVIFPAVNQTTKSYTTAHNHVVNSPDVAKSYLRKLVKDKKKMQQVFAIFCAILIAFFILSSMYLQLSFSGLLSQDDLRYVFRTYLFFISSLTCSIFILCCCHRTLIPGYVLDFLHQTAGTYWNRLAMMAGLDESVPCISQTSDSDILFHLGEEMPDPEELLTLHLRDKSGFDFKSENDFIALFKGFQDFLSLELPSVRIMPSERYSIFKNDVSIRSCREFFNVMKEQRAIGFFYISYSSLRDENVDTVAND
ncbi:hypothetical protein KCU98_g3830, partial [Aureobasidium melanogenum]